MLPVSVKMWAAILANLQQILKLFERQCYELENRFIQAIARHAKEMFVIKQVSASEFAKRRGFSAALLTFSRNSAKGWIEMRDMSFNGFSTVHSV